MKTDADFSLFETYSKEIIEEHEYEDEDHAPYFSTDVLES